MLDSTRSRPHGPPKPRSLERTYADAWRTTSGNTLPYSPLGRDPPLHSKRHLGASPLHRSGCLGADPSRIGGGPQAILREAGAALGGVVPPRPDPSGRQAVALTSR